MSKEEIESILLDNNLEGASYFNDEYETAIIGYTDDGRIAYSYEGMVDWLVKSDNMEYEEAEDYINYNVIRSLPYMGNKSPVIIYKLVY